MKWTHDKLREASHATALRTEMTAEFPGIDIDSVHAKPITVLCVCKSGSIYDAEWVRRLRDGFWRNLQRHELVCLSDIDVPCKRIPLQHDWPGWWSKIEMFRPGVITGPTLYVDLDTVITGDLNKTRDIKCDFAMLRSFWTPDMVGSGVMWFSGKNVPHKVYEKFAKQPQAFIKHYERNASGPYVGDQAFVWDTLDHDVERINDHLDGIYSYKLHCKKALPKAAKIVCFHGQPRPTDVKADWMERHWA